MNVYTYYELHSLNLHALGRLEEMKSNVDSRKNASAISDVYRLIRDAELLMVRDNMDHNFIVDIHISDYVELTYLSNSKSMIVPGSIPSDAGVLGFTHHLLEFNFNRIYASYGNCKSRVFNNNILNELKFLFDCHVDKIGENTKTDFTNNYRDLSDAFYAEIGEYWVCINTCFWCNCAHVQYF